MGDEQENQPVERGAAEDAAGAPVTPTEVEASRRPPSEPSGRESTNDSSGGSGGTSNTPGHPDAA